MQLVESSLATKETKREREREKERNTEKGQEGGKVKQPRAIQPWPWAQRERVVGESARVSRGTGE